ncbi:MAG: nuclear transport factor 2 family protein [Tepidiformaceae bacterium]
MNGNPALQLVRRLEAAVNAHDLEAVVACFAADYRNETPLHPERDFIGREQVRRNWEQIFSFIPDVRADVTKHAADGDTVWSEWEHRGTRRDGTAHLMRGVVIFGVEDGRAAWARFYLEPVESGGGDVDAAVRRQVVREASS